MKKIMYSAILLFSSICFSQKEHIIDLSENVLVESFNLTKGEHVFIIKYLTKSENFYYKIESETNINVIPPLSITESIEDSEESTEGILSLDCKKVINNLIKKIDAFDDEIELKDFLESKELENKLDKCKEIMPLNKFKERFFKRTEVIKIKKREQFSITIKKVRVSDTKVVKEWKRHYNTQKNGKWITSFGVGASMYLNRETFRSVESSVVNPDDGTTSSVFTVEEGGSKDIFQYTPVVMFTYLNQLSKDVEWGPSAGINFDISNISAFGGISIVWAQNMVFTTGLSFQQQQRLDSLYKEGDEIPSSLSFDQLHEKYFRINPFVSLSLRLAKNPFKSKPDKEDTEQ